MIDEEEDDVLNEQQIQSDIPQQHNLSHNMQYLLRSGRFEIGESSIDAVISGLPEQPEPTIVGESPQPASDILCSCLHNTHTNSSSASSEALIDSLELQPPVQVDDPDIVGVPQHRSKHDITDFTLGLAI